MRSICALKLLHGVDCRAAVLWCVANPIFHPTHSLLYGLFQMLSDDIFAHFPPVTDTAHG